MSQVQALHIKPQACFANSHVGFWLLNTTWIRNWLTNTTFVTGRKQEISRELSLCLTSGENPSSLLSGVTSVLHSEPRRLYRHPQLQLSHGNAMVSVGVEASDHRLSPYELRLNPSHSRLLFFSALLFIVNLQIHFFLLNTYSIKNRWEKAWLLAAVQHHRNLIVTGNYTASHS